jgi:NAD(P)-dependent dehydrogenase (short-subunit alcohol dehydrogenase family)
MTILREGLLEGRVVALGGAGGGGVGDGGVGDALRGLGARVETVPVLDGADEERVGEWARSQAPLHALVYVESGFDDVLAGAWAAVREVAAGTLIPSEQGGKIVLVAPADDAVVAAALENLARTLSVEWARFGVTVVAVAPGPHARPRDVDEVVCYLVSPAGEYFSGCRFDLGLTEVAAPGG